MTRTAIVTEPSLENLCSSTTTRPRKEYAYYLPTPTCSEHQEVFLINIRSLAGALHGDPVWATSACERSPETFKSIKYHRALFAVKSGQAIYMPWLTFRKGRTRLVDGRHRLYALLDEGYTHAQIVVDPPAADAIRTLVDDEDAKPGSSL